MTPRTNGSPHGKVCVVFHFGRLRSRLNETLNPETAALEYQGTACRQFFSVNYGIVGYLDWDRHQANVERLRNPVEYTYMKGMGFRMSASSASRSLRRVLDASCLVARTLTFRTAFRSRSTFAQLSPMARFSDLS